MFNRRYIASFGFVSIAAALLPALSSATAIAQCGGHGGMGGGHDHGAANDDYRGGHSDHQCHLPNGGPPAPVRPTPHGGLFLELGPHSLEVVYLPRETRVYLYEKSRGPLSTRDLRGEMSPQLRSEGDRPRIPLQHVPQPLGSKDQDYLAAAVEVAQLPDETPIAFRFENLPDRRQPKAEFNPVFSQSQVRRYVARVSLTLADREGLAEQQTCPVTGARLGSMGDPVKVLVGDRPLYLCCVGCIGRVIEMADERPSEPLRGVGR